MNGKVLIVDDSPILRRSMRRALEQIGVTGEDVHEAGHGQAALEELERFPATLVLLDLNMPVMNGEEFLTELKNRPEYRDLAVVIVTTESNSGRLMRLSNLGITGFLHKPFEPEDLREIAGQALGLAS
jgi:two-component system, chemotaxis family, chemotaxis protein CheY